MKRIAVSPIRRSDLGGALTATIAALQAEPPALGIMLFSAIRT